MEFFSYTPATKVAVIRLLLKGQSLKSICDILVTPELLRTFSRSSRGTPAIQYIILQNPEHMSILPAISIFGPLAILWDLQLNFVNVLTPMLLFKLYTHCGYSVPENTAQI
ncbi:hypothetical protein VP01_3609g3 [Puccinia sorghi]|uniref:Uncharacterized protein n=1 Tax=Puccinia sorghi TaxID=27349 RepID=A0A0L6UV38_9BASI|nr:hypothetical protein VP01_3609g3 [Puccinia sorghi]